jgi:hypothetical protein
MTKGDAGGKFGAMNRCRVHAARQIEVHQNQALQAVNFAIGLSENAARPLGSNVEQQCRPTRQSTLSGAGQARLIVHSLTQTIEGS